MAVMIVCKDEESRMMNQTLCLALLALTICSANAQHTPASPPIDVRAGAHHYAGESIIRVRTTSQAQLDATLALASDVWSERIGIGVLEIQISRIKLADLATIGVPHDTLIPDLQAHLDQQNQEMQAIRAAQAREKPEGFQRGASVHDDDWFATYRTLDEIQAYTQNIVDLRPDLASIAVIGQSWEGRDMHSITISGPDTPDNPVAERAAIFIFSTVHAREWIAPMTTCYIASKLVSDYDTDDQVRMLLDRARVVVVPIGNPDGYLFTWSDERFWRNTRRDNGDGTFGVNINRNWGYEWGNEGSSGNTSSTNYRGTHAFSEPETRALRDLAHGLGDKIVAHIDYHSYSQLIMWPYGYREGVVTPEPYATIFESIATQMADTIFDTTGAGYDPIQSIDLYAAAGNSKDWFFGELNRISYTVELRNHSSFTPPASDIHPCALENYEAFRVFVEQSIIPQRIAHVPAGSHRITDPDPVRLFLLSGFDPAFAEYAHMHTRVPGADSYTTTQMTTDQTGTYVAHFPDIACNEQIEYYFTVEQFDGTITTLPEDWSTSPYTSIATSMVVHYADSFELEGGWIPRQPTDMATAGFWQRAIPSATSHAPGADHTPDGSYCWITDARTGPSPDDFDVDGGITSLLSPRFSATESSVLTFWYWLGPLEERFDNATVLLSNDDGLTWRSAGAMPRRQRSEWVRHEVRIADFIEPSHDMRAKFLAADRRDDHTVEVAIDDVAVVVPGCAVNDADLNADGSLDSVDVSIFIDAYLAVSPTADRNQDRMIDFFDVAAFLAAFLDS